MTRKEWNPFSCGSAIRRARYAEFGRDIVAATGNWRAPVDDPPEDATAALREALEDEEPLVRAHAAWALRLSGSAPPDPG